MKIRFCHTKSTRRFNALCESLGLGLVYGPPGLGKTTAAVHRATMTAAGLIIANPVMSARSLLAEIVHEAGERPKRYAQDLFHQARELLKRNKRLWIVDEADFLMRDWRLIETVRSLHDQTGSPILLIGMADAERKVARFRHLHDRLRGYIMKFKPLDLEDTAGAARQLCEVALSECAVAHIHEDTGGNFRALQGLLYQAEKIAGVNRLKTVRARHLRSLAKPRRPGVTAGARRAAG